MNFILGDYHLLLLEVYKFNYLVRFSSLIEKYFVEHFLELFPYDCVDVTSFANEVPSIFGLFI